MQKFGGKVFFINRDNVNTDEIIPAKYLTYIEKAPLKPHLLEDLKVDGIDPTKISWDQYQVIISRENFGSGSSREMAVWAFEVNGITTIIASNFARIFRENCYNRGVLAIELGKETIEEIFNLFSQFDNVDANIELSDLTVSLSADGNGEVIERKYSFELNPFQRDLVEAGGWVSLAQQKY